MTSESPKHEQRPWGSFTVLDEADGFKVKRIEVLPGKRLSYQKHSQRAEHWIVVNGTAKVTLDDQDLMVETGNAIDIAVGAAHRVENPGRDLLVFIEVQRGPGAGGDGSRGHWDGRDDGTHADELNRGGDAAIGADDAG